MNQRFMRSVSGGTENIKNKSWHKPLNALLTVTLIVLGFLILRGLSGCADGEENPEIRDEIVQGSSGFYNPPNKRWSPTFIRSAPVDSFATYFINCGTDSEGVTLPRRITDASVYYDSTNTNVVVDTKDQTVEKWSSRVPRRVTKISLMSNTGRSEDVKFFSDCENIR